MGMNIGEVAERSGVSPRMIRHYEKIGLIPSAPRRSGGYRTYSEGDVHRLRFIAHARYLGFAIEEISMLLDLWSDRERPGAQVGLLAAAQVGTFQRKVKSLEAMQQCLLDLVGHADDDQRRDYPVLFGISGRV